MSVKEVIKSILFYSYEKNYTLFYYMHLICLDGNPGPVYR